MLLFESGVVALVLASCGGDDAPAPQRLQPEPDAGDEQPISVRVAVSIGEDGVTTARPGKVAAFLPLRFVITNTTSQSADVRITKVGRRTVAPLNQAVLRTPGLQPGRVFVNRSIHQGAVVRVVAGG